ncbi:hypothetical protein SEA_OTTAWA_82 [Arthrobacter phage Ottawa]|nr:hypothetical protein SEA_KHARCHO_82 [Arthrobacter phage Kharcho]WIC89314.1 hypothetical protein SEA_OTTAWA_82 [Arthrobacter phage Ottawa]
MDPRYPDIKVDVGLNDTHADNRIRVIVALQQAGEFEAAVEFITDVARETQGRLHRSRWIKVAQRYVTLNWHPSGKPNPS